MFSSLVRKELPPFPSVEALPRRQRTGGLTMVDGSPPTMVTSSSWKGCYEVGPFSPRRALHFTPATRSKAEEISQLQFA